MPPILLHTICLEPARWGRQRVSRPLPELLPSIASSEFTHLEVFEPHLEAPDSVSLLRLFKSLNLTPSVLSSYINFNPAVTADDALEGDVARVMKLLVTYGFKKIRLFPGPGMKPADSGAAALFASRIAHFARLIPDVEILLETHDGSLADDPALLVSMVENLHMPNIGLLYQPTTFSPEAALEQMRLQKRFIRHVHLQNRNPDLSFARLEHGVIPWKRLLAELPRQVPMTIEFVPAGICPVEEFDLKLTLQQAREDAAYVRELVAASGLA